MQSHEQNYFTLNFRLENAIPHVLQMYVNASPWQGIYLSYQMNLFAAFFTDPLAIVKKGIFMFTNISSNNAAPWTLYFLEWEIFLGALQFCEYPVK